MQLISKQGHVQWLELPAELALRTQVFESFRSHSQPWPYLEAPSESLKRARSLEGFPLVLFWLVMIFGSLALGSSLQVSQWFQSSGGLFVIGMFVVGPGRIWSWNAWRMLWQFPSRYRFELALYIGAFPNAVFYFLLLQFLIAFSIARITP
jgi:hypothetical protein